MEFVSNQPILRLKEMGEKIGQMAHDIPTVFSFFLPEFQLPSSRLSNATLVSPESGLLDTPKTLRLINGLLSLAKWGLTDCEDGFAHSPKGVCTKSSIQQRLQGE